MFKLFCAHNSSSVSSTLTYMYTASCLHTAMLHCCCLLLVNTHRPSRLRPTSNTRHCQTNLSSLTRHMHTAAVLIFGQCASDHLLTTT
eukprot:11181-Heterococcus_DN1.PRE.2